MFAALFAFGAIASCSSESEIRGAPGPALSADASSVPPRKDAGPPDGRVPDQSHPEASVVPDAKPPSRPDSMPDPDAMPPCFTNTLGVVSQVSPGLPQPAGYAEIHQLVADETGAYFTVSVPLRAQPELLFASPTADAGPAVLETGKISSFTVAQGRAWYLDDRGALMNVDLTTGQTEQSRPQGLAVASGIITDFESKLYWLEVDTAPAKYRLVRAVVAAGGSLGTPETLRETTDPIGPLAVGVWGLVWREAQFVMVQPTGGALENQPIMPAHETRLRIAMNPTASFTAENLYEPVRDGGCPFPPSISFPCNAGGFQGAWLVKNDPVSHIATTLQSSRDAEILPIAATDDAVYWVEHTLSDNCRSLWRQKNDSVAPEYIASGSQAPVDHLAANAERVYWLNAENVLQHYP